MPNLPPINALRALDAVVRHGRFVKAAEELHVTHGAVSKQIRLLEEFYQTQLFIRTASEVRLTSRGLRIHRTVVKALDALASTLHERDSDELSGDLRLLLPPAFGASWLLPRLKQFNALYPDITLRVSISPEVLHEPDDSVDVTVVYGRPNWPNKSVSLLREIALFPVCSPTLVLDRSPLFKPADLAQYPLLHEDDGTAWASWLVAAKAGIQTGCKNHYIPDVHHLLIAACEGMGVVLGDNVTARSYLQSGALIKPFKKTLRSAFSYYLVSQPETERTQRSRAFIDWISTLE